jgi:hypothetical protein
MFEAINVEDLCVGMTLFTGDRVTEIKRDGEMVNFSTTDHQWIRFAVGTPVCVVVPEPLKDSLHPEGF